MADSTTKQLCLRRKASQKVSFCVKKSRNEAHRKIMKVLQKDEKDRTTEDLDLLQSSSNGIVKEVQLRLQRKKKLLDRQLEVEDSSSVLSEKCKKLADAIRSAQYLVVYSGAGVSTSASIPDYRGSNGIWTLMQQGKDIGNHDLSQAEPTTAHMALFALYREGLLKYVVSQNCDGLHLRSGLPRRSLSEVHGNMYLEVCTKCNFQVWRLFDVTEHTGRYAHQTARRCSQCCEPLRDTIVHFGERGSLAWPINWSGACQAAKQADVILCIGSSLKVLKRYPWLWGMDKPVKKRPQLYIVNLQWTPKDDQATLKINGKCDEVMKMVMEYLNIPVPKYDRHLDPIFSHATILHPLEEHTTSTQILLLPEKEEEVKSEASEDADSYDNKEGPLPEVKQERDLWRPYSSETPSVQVKSEYSNGFGLCGSSAMPYSYSGTGSVGFTFRVELFDHVYAKLSHSFFSESTLDFRTSSYEPLDLSKPKGECEFCFTNFDNEICQFYKKRETKLPSSGPVCYCCDSDDETMTDAEKSNLSDQEKSDKKAPPNPGWFGKGYRKRIPKKKR